jgi:hypothetical protein
LKDVIGPGLETLVTRSRSGDKVRKGCVRSRCGKLVVTANLFHPFPASPVPIEVDATTKLP